MEGWLGFFPDVIIQDFHFASLIAVPSSDAIVISVSTTEVRSSQLSIHSVKSDSSPMEPTAMMQPTYSSQTSSFNYFAFYKGDCTVTQ